MATKAAVLECTQVLFVEADDSALLSRRDVAFPRALPLLTAERLSRFRERYHRALYEHNRQKPTSPKGKTPSRESVLRQLAMEKAMARAPQGKLFKATPEDEERRRVSPGAGGRPRVEFVSLVRAFLGVATMGLDPDPKTVHVLLTGNPSFARLCGFSYEVVQPGRVVQGHVPSLRKLQEFDQIMSKDGIWSDVRADLVHENLQTGRVAAESDLVIDTTHFPANSGSETVELSAEDVRLAGLLADDRPDKRRSPPKPTKKCVPRVAKRCGCKDKDRCAHPYEPTDRGAGVVAKQEDKFFWAHKASIVAFADSEVPLDAVAITYASTNDGTTLVPHLERVHELYPEVFAKAKRVIADSAYDSQGNREGAQRYGLQLVAPIAERNRPIRKAVGLPGIKHFTKSGIPVCDADRELEFASRRLKEHKLSWGPPILDDGTAACASCPLKPECCPAAGDGRTLEVDATEFPQIDWDLPQHSAEFSRVYDRRTAIERVNNVLKLDLKRNRLSKRDTENFQARLDKAIAAIHLVIASEE